MLTLAALERATRSLRDSGCRTARVQFEVTPDEIHFTTLFDEIVFTTDDESVSYRAHTVDRRGPLHALCRRFRHLHMGSPDAGR